MKICLKCKELYEDSHEEYSCWCGGDIIFAKKCLLCDNYIEDTSCETLCSECKEKTIKTDS